MLDESIVNQISEEEHFESKYLLRLVELSYSFSKKIDENVNGEVIKMLLKIARYNKNTFDPIMRCIHDVFYK